MGLAMVGGLSPRRRLLVVAVFVLLLVVAVAIAVATAPKEERRPAPIGTVVEDQPGPVLLIPGYGGGTGSLSVLASRLKAAGRDVTIVKLPGDATGDLNEQADALDGYVTSFLDKGF